LSLTPYVSDKLFLNLSKEYLQHIFVNCMLKEFGFQTDEVGNEDNHFRVGKMAVMK
jgi:hypothetical protein